MIKVLIIDDEKRTRDLIHKMILSFGLEVECFSIGESIESGMKAISEHQPDIVLLDVQLPDGTGLDMLNRLPDRNFKVIFITAHEEYAIRAIKLDALDYLLKPVDREELKTAITKAIAEIVSFQQTNSTNNQSIDPKKKRLVLKTLESVHVVDLKNIIRCEADRNYTTFYLLTGNKIVISKTLKEFESLLSNYNFMRIQQSHLINLDYVERYDKINGGHVVMQDNSQIPLSPSKRDFFFKSLENI